MVENVVLGYWDFRGRAGPIRLLLKYTGVAFEDKRYELNYAERAKSHWFDIKHSLGFDFPNLPYLIDGNVKLTQTVAIMRYLGRKHHLSGSNEQEQIRIELLEQQLVDLAYALHEIRFIKNGPEAKAAYVENLKIELDVLDKFIGANHWVSGSDHLSYVDFSLYEYLRNVNTKGIVDGVVQSYANLTRFMARFEHLPQIAEYLKEMNAKE